MKAKDEDLRELIEKFMDAKNARTYLEDIEAGERILRQYPAPEPDDMVIANIKANMSLHKLPKRTVTFRKRVFEAIAVAASIAIIAIISFSSLRETPTRTPDTEVTRGYVPINWLTDEDVAFNNTLENLRNDVRSIGTQISQLETDDYGEDAFILDEFQNQIEQVKDHLTGMDTAIYASIDSPEADYSSTSSIIENIENQLNELSGSFWQDDYSNAGVYE